MNPLLRLFHWAVDRLTRNVVLPSAEEVERVLVEVYGLPPLPEVA